MKQRYGNRVLLWAFAISALAHVIIALVARVPHVEAAPEQRPTRMQMFHIAHSPPPPTPTPPPQLQPAQPRRSVSQAPRLHPSLPQLRAPAAGATAGPVAIAPAGSGAGEGPQAVAGSPAPARPACSAPDVPAHTISAAMPQTPDGVAGLPATAAVQVTLDATGRITDVRIYQSAGDPQLDRAATAAARASTYAPSIVDCLPAGGTYLFRVDFQE
jgi:TonB family protein